MTNLTKEVAGILTALTAIVAWFVTPVIRFAPATPLYFSGFAMVLGLAAIWLRVELREHAGKELKVVSWIFAPALVGFMALTTYAASLSDANDARCFNIQRQMLFPEPARQDLPELFTALGCRPQGQDDIQFPVKKAVTKSEKPATNAAAPHATPSSPK